mgnify:CR=1 FL=1
MLLRQRLGPEAGRLHTARSRNDQVATDLRLWLRRALDRLDGAALGLEGEVALFFGYVRHYKGLDTLLTAWKQVRAARPGATLVVAGEFYEKPELYEALAREAGGVRLLNRYIPDDEVEALSGRDMTFAMGEMKIPFTVETFLLSFSLPNFYFHAATAYDILRAQGVPLEYHEYPGNHAWTYWRTHAAESLTWLGARLAAGASPRRR